MNFPRSSISSRSVFALLALPFPAAGVDFDFELDNLGRFAGGDGAKSLGSDWYSTSDASETVLYESGDALRTISTW